MIANPCARQACGRPLFPENDSKRSFAPILGAQFQFSSRQHGKQTCGLQRSDRSSGANGAASVAFVGLSKTHPSESSASPAIPLHPPPPHSYRSGGLAGEAVRHG